MNIEDYLRSTTDNLDPENDPGDAALFSYVTSLEEEDLVALLRLSLVVAAMHLVGDPVGVSDELKFESINRVLELLKESVNNAK